MHRYMHSHTYRWTLSHVNMPIHMYIYNICMHMPKGEPLFFLVSEPELVATWVQWKGWMNSLWNESLMSQNHILFWNWLLPYLTTDYPGRPLCLAGEIDIPLKLMKYLSVSPSVCWTLAFGKNSFNKRPDPCKCVPVSPFSMDYTGPRDCSEGSKPVDESISGDQVLNGFFIAHLSRKLLFQLLAVRAG